MQRSPTLLVGPSCRNIMNVWLIGNMFDFVALLLLGAVVALYLLIAASVRRLSRSQMVSVVKDEDGAAYAVGYALVIPV